MPWWRLLSRQISRNRCWLKTSGVFRPGKTAVLRQHLNSRCSKIHVLAGEVLQSLTSDVFKTQLDKALVWCHSWPSFDKEVGSWRHLEVPSSHSGCESCTWTAVMPWVLKLVKPCASTSLDPKSYISANPINFQGVFQTSVNLQSFCKLSFHVTVGEIAWFSCNIIIGQSWSAGH